MFTIGNNIGIGSRFQQGANVNQPPAENHGPTDIAISAATVTENNAVGDVIGAFSTSDPDDGNTFAYTLVAGTGSTDNASFTILGANLKAAEVFDYEVKSSYSIRVRSTDQGGLWFEKAFTINVTDVYEEVAEYTTVYNAMTVKPSQADREKQNALVKGLKDLGVWSKAIVLDILAAHNEQASLLNWKSPGTFNPSKNATPTFTANKGFKSVAAATAYIKSNFIPSTNGAGFLGQNDMTVIVGVNDELDEGKYVFGAPGTNGIAVYPRYNNGAGLVAINGAVASTYNSRLSKRYFTVSRNSATQIESYKNICKQVLASNSVSLCNTTLTIGGLASYNLSERHISFALVFKYLTETEVRGVINLLDTYLNGFGNKIRPFPVSTYFNLVTEGHSFFTSTDILPDTLSGVCNSIALNNFAVSGNTTGDLVARAATVDAKLVAETSTLKNIMALWIGVNSVTETAGTGAPAYESMKSYIQARVAAGWKVFVYTMTKATGYPDRGAQFEIERNIFNNLMRNDLALLSNVYILDTDTVPELQNPADTTYFANTLHPNSLGLSLAADLFKNKISEVYP